MSADVTDLTRGVYRRLYSGFITGQRISKLSLQAEAWFWRVLATVDDFGNAHADPDLCRAATVGRRKIPAKQISEWLRQMKDVGLIEFYTVKGEPFLHVVGFEASQPANRNGKRIRRFPTPDESGGIRVIPDLPESPENDTENENGSNNGNGSLVAKTRRVFEFWQGEMDHQKARLDDKRQKAITQRLKDGYTVEDLTAAIRGCKLTPFNMGQNDRQEVYDGIDLICRDADHVDRFMRKAGVAAPTAEDRKEREARLSREMGWDKLERTS